MKYFENIKLKEARINAGVSVHDMAYMLDINASNLSKYEKGILKASREILYGYHIITGQQIGKLQKPFFADFIETLSLRITELISKLEGRGQSLKINVRIEHLNSILENMTCLKDESQREYE